MLAVLVLVEELERSKGRKDCMGSFHWWARSCKFTMRSRLLGVFSSLAAVLFRSCDQVGTFEKRWQWDRLPELCHNGGRVNGKS